MFDSTPRNEPYAITRTLLFQGWVPWTRNDFAEAERIWRRALDIATATDDRWSEVRALTSLSIDLTEMRQRLDEADELIERARTVARAMGDRFSEAVAQVYRPLRQTGGIGGRVLVRTTGEPTEATRLIREAVHGVDADTRLKTSEPSMRSAIARSHGRG